MSKDKEFQEKLKRVGKKAWKSVLEQFVDFTLCILKEEIYRLILKGEYDKSAHTLENVLKQVVPKSIAEKLANVFINLLGNYCLPYLSPYCEDEI